MPSGATRVLGDRRAVRSNRAKNGIHRCKQRVGAFTQADPVCRCTVRRSAVIPGRRAGGRAGRAAERPSGRARRAGATGAGAVSGGHDGRARGRGRGGRAGATGAHAGAGPVSGGHRGARPAASAPVRNGIRRKKQRGGAFLTADAVYQADAHDLSPPLGHTPTRRDPRGRREKRHPSLKTTRWGVCARESRLSLHLRQSAVSAGGRRDARGQGPPRPAQPCRDP